MVAALLESNPRKRPSAASALTRPWMTVRMDDAVTAVAPGKAARPGLTAARLHCYASRMYLPTIELAPRDVLMREGELAVDLFYILQGTVEMLVDAANGGNLVRIALLGDGEFVGEEARPATRGARARTAWRRGRGVKGVRRRWLAGSDAAGLRGAVPSSDRARGGRCEGHGAAAAPGGVDHQRGQGARAAPRSWHCRECASRGA